MGAVISKAANGVGGVLGNAFVAPLKSIFGRSCEDVCSGPWDVVCFIEHLCVNNLVKLLMILVLCYITLLFVYLLFKVGICQCILRSLCKMCCAACEAYWFALENITCFLWHKLKNTKRVNRRHCYRDVELGYSSSDESGFPGNYGHLHFSRKRKSFRGRRKDTFYPSSKHGRHVGCSHRHRHGRLKSRELSVHVSGGSRRLRNSRWLQISRVRNRHRKGGIFKRRRLR
ncbi:Protein HAPLESS 2 [Quillaja saponaria]|uniref:Protein HAPLESS 2 n=1 Tax=Quillaja saponaria TaxID=32244 RepID=A0AAD7L6E5_QUISA|nr:Protein HAPLESS 2 [Quillaja saponaria]